MFWRSVSKRTGLDESEAYPNPDDTDPSSRYTVHISEAPVTISSNDRGNELGYTERTHESERGTFHEEESMRTSHEDQSLRDNSNLQVNDSVKLFIVGIDRRSKQSNPELVLEEVGLQDDNDKDYTVN